mmetsp:Transcript_63897/g.152400  ORF Transcript_63897/g.152400 Transcript_63897/m.152400 type:complete len:425 (+) Transcript_63897:110-1384(+)
MCPPADLGHLGKPVVPVPPPPVPPAAVRSSGGERKIYGRHQPGPCPWDNEADEEVARKIKESCIVHEKFWSEDTCAAVERVVDQITELAARGAFKERTVDRTPLRNKYFFGFGYTYGPQVAKRGDEQLLPPHVVDPIPDFIREALIKPIEAKGWVPEGWINSAVVNDYKKGGMIVSHIDPPQLFARPILINTFLNEGRLVFGSKFSFPIKGGGPSTTRPKFVCPMPRGSLTVMGGYSADGITHGLRPEDMDGRRVSIILRHVLDDAPKLGDPVPSGGSIPRPMPSMPMQPGSLLNTSFISARGSQAPTGAPLRSHCPDEVESRSRHPPPPPPSALKRRREEALLFEGWGQPPLARQRRAEEAGWAMARSTGAGRQAVAVESMSHRRWAPDNAAVIAQASRTGTSWRGTWGSHPGSHSASAAFAH